LRYLLRRLGFYLIAAWVSITLNFAIPRMMPGDPASAIFSRFRGQLSPEALTAMRAAFGFTGGSLPHQYFTYLRHLARGELGTSLVFFPAPVSEVVGTALKWTLLLAGCSVVIAFLAGTLLGTVAAFRRGGWLDSVAPPVLTFLGAFPYFFLAMLLLYFLGFTLGWFPLAHAYDDLLDPGWTSAFAGSVLWHLVLPATTIVVASVGGWMLGMRNNMISVLAEDYLVMAHAKGLPARRIMFHYAARNALLPGVTGFGMALGFVLSGSLLTEIVFSYPGQGYLLLEAVVNQDYPLLQGLFLTITLAVLGANLLVDVAYLWLDPRTRLE
jgi:peptide/nickel transport system permease protein